MNTMAVRIAGVTIPNDKRVEVALTYIFGIGRTTANQILQKAQVERDVDEAGGESKEDLKGKKAPSAAVRRKKKEKKTGAAGRAYINATYNNTIITLTDPGGNAVAWSSAGACGFKGAKKATPYAAQVIVKKAVDKAKE